MSSALQSSTKNGRDLFIPALDSVADGAPVCADRMKLFRPNGLHWVTAALFIVADIAGGGVVAMPIALLKSGGMAGAFIIVIISTSFCYTAHILGENWLLMCEKWPLQYAVGCRPTAGADYGACAKPPTTAESHCRKPYPEMAFRSMGHRARTFTSVMLNLMFYAVSIVYLILAAKIISDFLHTAFDVRIGPCAMLLAVATALLPITFLKSPQDFWWAVVTAMLTTAFAVLLILIGTLFDAPTCTAHAGFPAQFQSDQLLLSLGIFMFSYGGHGVFPTIQHDMEQPQQFSKAAVLAFAIVTAFYTPITVLGYQVYGDSLQESIISSIQIPLFQITANLCIAVHCILTLTVVINPLNQQVEHILNIPHHFGWKRVVVRTAVMVSVVFTAETVPSFGPILNLIGGTMIALSSAIMPCLFYLFLNARFKRKRLTHKVSDTSVDSTSMLVEERPATLMEVLENTELSTLLINVAIIVLAVVGGVVTTRSALVDILSTSFSAPCYLSSTSLGAENVQSTHCCGAFRNISRFGSAEDYCTIVKNVDKM